MKKRKIGLLIGIPMMGAFISPTVLAQDTDSASAEAPNWVCTLRIANPMSGMDGEEPLFCVQWTDPFYAKAIGGMEGMSGMSGMSGMDGMSGMSGMDGMSGMSGMDGMSGMSGMSGMGGMSGMDGMSGMSGMSGMGGMSGMSGMAGMDGMSGMSGMAGMDGMSGMSGMAGMDGMSGMSGMAGMGGMSGMSGMAGQQGGYSVTLSELRFGVASAVLTEAAQDYVQQQMAGLPLHPGLKYKIVGHTDNVGSAESNLSLSLKRAKAVKDYFVASGIDGTSIEVAGQGESAPVAANDTPEGRSQNRRVEVTIY